VQVKEEKAKERRRWEQVGAQPRSLGSGEGPKSQPTTASANTAYAGSAGKKAAAGKTAGQKAARPQVAGAVVPPDRPPKTSKRRKRVTIRRHVPRTAAVGVAIVPGWDGEVPSFADILRRGKDSVPDVGAHLGIKALHAKRSATDDLLIEIPGPDASRKADNLPRSSGMSSGMSLGFALLGRSGGWTSGSPDSTSPLRQEKSPKRSVGLGLDVALTIFASAPSARIEAATALPGGGPSRSRVCLPQKQDFSRWGGVG